MGERAEPAAGRVSTMSIARPSTSSSRSRTRRRLKVVLVVGVFPADTSHMAALAELADVVVYGSEFNRSQLTYEPTPPAECRSRTFRRLVPTTRSAHLLWLYERMGAALRVDRPDVLHVVSEPWGMLSVQASAWARRHPETILAVHGCDRIWWHGSAPERSARRLLARYTLSRADAYAAESPAAVARARDNGLRQEAQTDTIHTNPRDPAVFRPASDVTERAACRRALGLPVDGIGVGFLGRLAPEKGPYLLLDALQGLDRGNGTWCAVAGAGPEAQTVAAHTARLGGHFLGELSYPDEVELFYRSIDVLAVPSYRTADSEEQSPRVVVEAMMSSCIVVGTRSGAIPQMLGDAGIVVAERNVPALRHGLTHAIAIATDRGRRAASRERAVSLYSGEAVADRLLELWESARNRRQAA